jgi:peptidoglycan/LPS O-acetylase OafA/YrhL
MTKTRISILDGFRAIAIISVLLYHYFSRWTPPKNEISLYPYKSAYNYFGYGYLGVQFFFIISGFVIFFTLDNTSNFSSFWKKRLIRLVPSILIATIITFIVFRLFDITNLFPSSHELKNFLPSITFIHPGVLNNLFSNFDFNYINGSYWSLWPEIQFYALSSFLYYISKDKFIRNFILVSGFLIAANYFIKNISGSNQLHLVLPPFFLLNYIKWVENGFDLIEHLPFFCLGVIFYLLFKNNNSNQKSSGYVKFFLSILILFIVYSGLENKVRMISLLMIILFFAFIYIPKVLAPFENKTITSIGESSYFLYLIHENIGILIIYSFGSYFLPFGFILPVLLIITWIVLSNLYTLKIDKKINNWLKVKILKK